MSMTVTIPDEIGERLHAWALAAKESEEDVVRQALEAYLSVPPELREELEGWQYLGAEALEKVAPNAEE